MRARTAEDWRRIIESERPAEPPFGSARYDDGVPEITPEQLAEQERREADERQALIGRRSQTPVVCWENKHPFDSLIEAARFAGCDPGAIRHALKSRGTAGGYHWHRPGESDFKPARRTGRPGYKVLCEKSGRIFDSIQEAADSLGLKRNTVSLAVHGQRPCFGVRFRLVKDSGKGAA